ncbi:hypothetical protein [Streptomyces sp. NPDC015131]|uniref:hypothetical protein n=1 Tax=Streptomyces sp. NPDC015131 TaxID=3364941 RepID=UPI0036FC5911
MPATTPPRRTVARRPLAVTGGPAAGAPAAGPAGSRLPWWAVALPVLAFAVLLALLTGGGQARAAGGDPEVGRFLQQIQHTLAR